MPTAETHITRALYLLGASSPIKPASPEIKSECLKSFNDMVERWGREGNEIYLTRADVLGDEVNNDEWANAAIQYCLAVEIAPICRVPVPPDVMARQKELMRDLVATSRMEALVPNDCAKDSRMPLGSGVVRGRVDVTRFEGE